MVSVRLAFERHQRVPERVAEEALIAAATEACKGAEVAVVGRRIGARRGTLQLSAPEHSIAQIVKAMREADGIAEVEPTPDSPPVRATLVSIPKEFA